jgi:transcriptional regulator with XRE-family HTH domain
MIGERLKELRKIKKLRQLDIAEFLSIGRTTYTQYETGVTEPDINTLIKLADYFDVSSDYFLGRTNDRNLNSKENGNKAYHTLDVSDLPDEAIRQVEEYIELMKLKYYPDRTKK